ACNKPDMKCGNLCVDPTIDPNNCGGCANTCSAGFVCSESKCQCTSGNCDPAACGGMCKTAQSCLPDSSGTDACLAGYHRPACLHAGTVMPMLKAGLAVSGMGASMMDGPQSLAATEDGRAILALDANDDTLWAIDRATMNVLGSVPVQTS